MDLEGLTLQQLRVFQRVARTLSFTTTSGELHLSQSVVSRTIQMIERKVGVELFWRTSRSVQITPAGTEFSRIVDRTLETHLAGLARFERFLDGAEGTVSVAALPSLAATVVPPIVKSFAEASPGIAVSISDGLADEIVELVSTGRADLGLTAQATDAGDLAETPWVSDLLVALVAVGHPLAGESAVRWSDLVSFPFIGLTEGSSVRQLTDAGFAHTGVLPRYAHVVRSPMVVHGMVASGLGVAALPGFLAQLAPEALTVAVPIEEPTLRRQIVVATSSRHPRPRAVALFIRHLLEHTQ